jgi:L,D-transpeptidase ErfK/SrfK
MAKGLSPGMEGGEGLRSFLCLVLLWFSFLGAVLANPAIHINIPEYTLTLTDKGQLIKVYDIAVGTPYEQTPTGQFAVFDKTEYPVWYPGSKFTDQTPVHPGPDNPLGSRWMEFSPSYGIHGTNKDWDISYPVSGGCIRLHDADAQELYRKVPVGTPVTITYETLRIIVKADGLYLKVMPDIYNRQTSSQERFAEIFAPFSAKFRLIKPLAFPPKENDEMYQIKIAVPQTSVPAGQPPAALPTR